jgi:hypothetical protein
LKARLVSTLEPEMRYPGFKPLLFQMGQFVYRYATADDFANFTRGIAPGLPDVDDVIAPVTTLAGKFEVPDFDQVQQDVTGWFNGLEDPVVMGCTRCQFSLPIASKSWLKHFTLCDLLV